MKKVALITGASSGIGKELAIIHAEHGGDLVLIARRLEKLERLKAQLESDHGISVHLIVKDLTKHEAPKEIVDELNEHGIIVDYLINNAGFGGLGLFHERDWEDDQAMIQLNVMALTELTRRILPGMVDRNSGRILNVSSTAGIVPGPLQAVYYATKALLILFLMPSRKNFTIPKSQLPPYFPALPKPSLQKLPEWTKHLYSIAMLPQQE